jgi:hypothetical protein
MSATDGYALTPATDDAFGFTGYTTPSNSEPRMLRNSSPPIDPRLVEAPTTATLAGRKNGASDAVTARWSRSSTAVRYASVGAICSCTSVVPPSIRRETAKPASPNTLSIGRFSGITSATKVEIPVPAAVAASCSSRRVPIPCPWRASATAKATSAFAGSRSLT